MPSDHQEVDLALNHLAWQKMTKFSIITPVSLEIEDKVHQISTLSKSNANKNCQSFRV